MKEAIAVNLIDTFNFLATLENEQHGVIVSQYPNINGLPISFKKSDRSFQFSAAPIFTTVSPVKFQNIGYGILKPFKIKCEEKLYDIKYGTGKANFSLFKGLSSTRRAMGT